MTGEDFVVSQKRRRKRSKGQRCYLTLAAFSFTWLGGYLQERSKGASEVRRSGRG